MDSSEYEKMYQLEDANWWYSGRRGLVLSEVARLHKRFLSKSMKILDAGCGTGIDLKHLQTYGDAYGLDISKDALEFSRIRGLNPIICGSMDKLPLKSGFFDLVVALDVIEHIHDDISAIHELKWIEYVCYWSGIICVVFGAMGQISMKAGMRQVQRINDFSDLLNPSTIMQIFGDYYVMGGLIF